MTTLDECDVWVEPDGTMVVRIEDTTVEIERVEAEDEWAPRE